MTRRNFWNSAIIVLCFIAMLIVSDRVIAGMTLCRAAQTCPQGGR